MTRRPRDYPCLGCRRRFELADFRWRLYRQGIRTHEWRLCWDCAEVEVDALLLAALRTAKGSSLGPL